MGPETLDLKLSLNRSDKWRGLTNTPSLYHELFTARNGGQGR